MAETPEEYLKRQYDYSDASRLGRGVWYMWMVMAIEAKNKDERLVACSFMRGFCYRFKCGKCHGHCNKYFLENPPEPHAETSDLLFDWIVKFMSAVNVRTGRPPYDRNLLHKIVSEEEFMVCTEDCGKEEKPYVPPVAAVSTRIPEKIPLVGVKDSSWIKSSMSTFPGLITRARDDLPNIKMLPHYQNLPRA